MVSREGEYYLLATEAARHLKVGRSTFYRLYKDVLESVTIGRLKRLHYRLSELDKVGGVNNA